MTPEQMVVKTVLNKMMQPDHWVCICDIDKCLVLLDVPKPKRSKSYQMLSALHCVHWSDMEPTVRDMAKMAIMDVVSMESFNADSELTRLFGGETSAISGGKANLLSFKKPG